MLKAKERERERERETEKEAERDRNGQRHKDTKREIILKSQNKAQLIFFSIY